MSEYKPKTLDEIQKMKRISVEYLIDEDTYKRLEDLSRAMTEEHRKRASDAVESTPESAFSLAMITGSKRDIEEKISYVEMQYGLIDMETYLKRIK